MANMKNKDPLKELHKIRERNHDRTKNMSANEYIKHTQSRALGLKEILKSTNGYKELDNFFEKLSKKKKAS